MFEWNTASTADKVSYLGLRLQSQSVKHARLERYLRGEQPTAYLNPEVASQLQDRLSDLNVNYCALLVDALVQRISVTGFSVNGADDTDPRVWSVWQSNRMQTEIDWLLRDVLGHGRGYVLAWTDSQGRPTLSVESSSQCISYRDPVTREIEAVLKQWQSFDDVLGQNTSWSVLYEPDAVTTFASASPAAVNSIPGDSWRVIERVSNPLGVVPIVEFANRTSVLDFYGTSEFESITGLQDALNKCLQDAMVSSEFYSFPRRWITGLAVPNDEDGNPIQVFGTAWNETWAAESSETRFGQFEAASLQGFDVLSNTISRQISVVSGLPDYMTGAGSANPVSAEAIQVADIALNARTKQKVDLLTPSFAEVGALVLALITGAPVGSADVQPVFASLDRNSPAVATDSFQKLVTAGLPVHLAAKHALGLPPEDIEQIRNNTNDGS